MMTFVVHSVSILKCLFIYTGCCFWGWKSILGCNWQVWCYAVERKCLCTRWYYM